MNMCQVSLFRHRFIQVQIALHANSIRNGLFNELIQVLHADYVQHLLNILLTWANVARSEMLSHGIR